MDDHLSERTPLLQPAPVPTLLPFSRHGAHDVPRPRRRSSTSTSTSTSHARCDAQADISLAQLVHIVAALRAGHLPSTRQFLDLADHLLTSPSSLLAHESLGTVFEPTYGRGRLGVGHFTEARDALLTSVRDWLESARELVDKRNPPIPRLDTSGKPRETERDGWQEFLTRCRESEVKIDPPSLRETEPPRPEATSGSTSRPISSSLFSLVTLFFTSPEIRQLVIDLIVLVRDVARVSLDTEVQEDRVPNEVGDGLEKAVDFVAQRGISAIALDEAMKRENGEKVGCVETCATDAANEDPPLVDLASSPQIDQAEPVVPDQSPQEVRDAFVDRSRQILTRLQSTREYQSAMSTILDMVRSRIKGSVSRLQPSVSIDAQAQSPLELVVPLLEPFTGGPSSLSPLVQSFEATMSHFSLSNPTSTPHALTELASNVDSFLTNLLLSPDFLSSARAQRQVESVYESLSRVGTDQPEFNRDLQTLLHGVLRVASDVAQDEYLSKFVEATGRVMEEIERSAALLGITAAKAASGQGFLAIWGDLLEWIAPRILGVIKEVPIPRIEFDSPTVSGALEFPSLLSTSFVPASVTIRNSTSLTYLPTFGSSTQTLPIAQRSRARSQPHSSDQGFYERSSYASTTNVELTGMEFEILDVGYHVRLKPRFACLPTITESGLLDLHFGRAGDPTARGGVGRENGFGFSFDAKASDEPDGDEPTSRRSLFDMLPTSNVSLDAFDVRLHESDHPWFMWFVRPLLRRTIRKAIEVEVRKVMIEQGNKVGEWAYRVRECKHDVDKEDRDPARAGTMVWNWVRAVWRTMTPDEDETSAIEQRRRGEGGGDVDTEEERTSTTLHLNRHGLAVDLPRPIDEEQDGQGGGGVGATVGFGTEGVVIPEGEASIPLAPGQEPRIGVVERAKQEANEAVEEGRTAARNVWALVGGIGEASEEWRGDLEDETDKYEHAGWRSDAFDLRTRGER